MKEVVGFFFCSVQWDQGRWKFNWMELYNRYMNKIEVREVAHPVHFKEPVLHTLSLQTSELVLYSFSWDLELVTVMPLLFWHPLWNLWEDFSFLLNCLSHKETSTCTVRWIKCFSLYNFVWIWHVHCRLLKAKGLLLALNRSFFLTGPSVHLSIMMNLFLKHEFQENHSSMCISITHSKTKGKKISSCHPSQMQNAHVP